MSPTLISKICPRCKKDLPVEQAEKRKTEQKPILCEPCAIEIDKKLEQWYPIFLKFKL